MERRGRRLSHREFVVGAGVTGVSLVVLAGCIGPLAGSQPRR
jgi:hypothetical protein